MKKPDLLSARSHWDDDADIDEAELESFPASDPPAYTLGIERGAPGQLTLRPEKRSASARRAPGAAAGTPA